MNIFYRFAFRALTMNILKFFLVVILFCSCSSKKNIIYLQDIHNNLNSSYNYVDYKLKSGDILKINVASENVDANNLFNIHSSVMSTNKESVLYDGFLIDSKGYIHFPIVGPIMAAGLSVEDLRFKLRELILGKELLINPFVDVKHINAHFTVLGEVNNPGKHEFLKNDLNFIEAIGIAGDLTINGLRNNITLIRNNDGINNSYQIDMTKIDFLSSEYFQIFSGDIIIVNPNRTRVKNAGIIGNSGTLLSLLSFILSSVIVISNR